MVSVSYGWMNVWKDCVDGRMVCESIEQLEHKLVIRDSGIHRFSDVQRQLFDMNELPGLTPRIRCALAPSALQSPLQC